MRRKRDMARSCLRNGSWEVLAAAIHVPTPLGPQAHMLIETFLDHVGKEWPEAIDPTFHTFSADIDPAFVEQVLDKSKR